MKKKNAMNTKHKKNIRRRKPYIKREHNVVNFTNKQTFISRIHQLLRQSLQNIAQSYVFGKGKNLFYAVHQPFFSTETNGSSM